MSTRWMARNVVALAVTALGLLLAGFAAASAAEPDGLVSGQQFPTLAVDSLVTMVASDLNQFWSSQFGAEGLSYYPPHEFLAYTGSIDTPCGTFGSDNALYCTWSQGGLMYHAIYYDVNFLQKILNRNGDYAVAAVLAHEWGHLVQNLLGIFIGTQTILKELQADCLTGVYSVSVDMRGMLDVGDLDEALGLLYSLGDNLPLLHADAHGSPMMRRTAFTLGYQQGFVGCSFESINRLISGSQQPTPTPAPPPAGGGQNLRAFDLDADCYLSDQEFFGVTDQWIRATISDAIFFGAVDAWIGQMSICSAASSEAKPVELSWHEKTLTVSVSAQDEDVAGLQLEIFSMNGERLTGGQTGGESLTLSLSGAENARLANGVYLVLVTARDAAGRLIARELRKIAVLR